MSGDLRNPLRSLPARTPQVLAYLYRPLLPLLMKIKEAERKGGRGHAPKDILLPEGYVAEVVATGLSEPVHCCFDEDGFAYVTECGHKIAAKPRILRVDVRTGAVETFYDLPQEHWVKTGAMTGACWYRGWLYFNNTGALSRVDRAGNVEHLVTDLPAYGDHQNNHPVAGPDGKIYWGEGSATNTGVAGADSFAYEWIKEHPDSHDVPARDITLVGRNFEDGDLRSGDLTRRVSTGAYSPFGTPTRPGQVIAGSPKATGAILRCDPDGSHLEAFAWGLRNPYGLAFHPDGRLFATEHGIDERGHRYIVGDPEDLYEIREGEWYGWPDFASGIRLDDARYEGEGREPLLATHPNPAPPTPFAQFEPHAGPNGFDFCRDARFGFEGDAFVALFGDAAPVTARPATPRGFQVVRVDMRTGRVHPFAWNRIQGPASKMPHDGFERPSHCVFGPDGALYVCDFGELEIGLERGGVRAQQASGTLWRIRRTADATAPDGKEPRPQLVLPWHLLSAVAALLPVAALIACNQ